MSTADFLRQLQEKFDDEIKAEHARLKKPNVLIAGRTGVGKSTLINAMFGRDIARVGSGRPVTDCYTEYTSETVLVNLYDSTGWEGGAEKEAAFREDTERFLRAHRTKAVAEHIHIVWYAIDAPGARFTDFDAQLAKEAFTGLPLIFILTKSDIATDEQLHALRDAIERAHVPNSYGIIEVSADPLVRRGKPICEAFGLDEVITRTLTLIPELVRRAFISAQRVSLLAKDDEARKSLHKFAGTAFGIGFTPIPFSDAPLLITLQMGMVARMAVIYGFPPKHMVAASVSSLVGSLVASVAGTFLANLLKFVPGVGTIIGGVINGSVGASITFAVGHTFRALFNLILKKSMEGRDSEVTEEWIHSFVNDEFRKKWQQFKDKKGADVGADV